MSEITKKRTPKTEAELREKVVDQQLMKFKEEIQALEVKYGYKLEPAMYYSKMGAFPQIEVQRIKKEDTQTEESVV